MTRHKLLTLASYLIPLASILLLPSQTLAQTHPFMIVTPDQYSTLRNRSSQEPWLGMKQDAITTCLTLNYDSLNPPPASDKGLVIRDIMSSCALAFILDQTNQTSYKDKIITTIPIAWNDMLAYQNSTTLYDTNYYTKAASGFFNSVLALDIIHPSLTSQELSQAEDWLEEEFNYFYNNTRFSSWIKWPPTKHGVVITWKIYKGEFSQMDVLLKGGVFRNPDNTQYTIAGYNQEIEKRIGPDGVYYEGPGYAHAGFGFDRDERAHLIDVLEFTGIDSQYGLDYYTNPRFQAFYEWLYGYASTPFGIHVAFGDTSDFYPLWFEARLSRQIQSSHIAQASKFSAKAGMYAWWKHSLKEYPLPGRLLHYMLLSFPLPTPNTPPSRIFTSGGAFFHQQPVNHLSLYGALWNNQEPPATVNNPNDPFHMRKDTNAMYISGYGEPLLLNAGFNGASSALPRCVGFHYYYTNDRAVSNNVALIDYVIGDPLLPNTANDFVLTYGNGITEGFTGIGLDYASGNSGGALPNGHHQRNFVFVHPHSTIPGYFIVFDEISSTGQTAHIVLHPNSATTTPIITNTSYRAPLGPNVFNNPTAGLNIYLATTPQSVDLVDGSLCHWQSEEYQAYVGKYLFSTYPITTGNKQVATVLFPYDQSHTASPFTRLSGSHYSGGRLDHTSSTIDFAFEANSSTPLTQSGITFQAKAAFYRLQSNNLTHYFIRQGRSLTNGASPSTGFSSTQDISLYLNGTQGNIVSPGTSVTFRYPGLTGLRLNGQTISGSTGSNTFTATIPQGTHTLELITNNTPTPTAPASTPTPTPTPINYSLDNDTDIDIFDILILISRFTQNLVGDFNQNGRIDIFDFNTLLKNRL
jgi:hypothetical protein